MAADVCFWADSWIWLRLCAARNGSGRQRQRHCRAARLLQFGRRSGSNCHCRADPASDLETAKQADVFAPMGASLFGDGRSARWLLVCPTRLVLVAVQTFVGQTVLMIAKRIIPCLDVHDG